MEEAEQILFSRFLPLTGLFLPLQLFLAPVKGVADAFPMQGTQKSVRAAVSVCSAASPISRGYCELVGNGDDAQNMIERCHRGVKKKNRCRMEL